MFDYYYNDAGLIIDSRVRPRKMIIREPRPVFHEEMKFYHLDDVFEFQDSVAPYFWSEATTWFYQGRKAGKIVYGEDCTQTRLVVDPSFTDRKLTPCDLDKMNELNSESLKVLVDETVKQLQSVYKPDYAYHVSFSGGKDSTALFELMKESELGSFDVVFCDTQMENPFTYEYVDGFEQSLLRESIPFYRAKSRLEILESWRLFGPPSRYQRWCCSVHKSVPFGILTKELGYKKNANLIGVRRSESVMRRTREFVIDETNSKIKNERIINAIIDWTSAEVWSYIFSKKVPFNKSYRVGFRRVGCLICPMSGGER